MRLDGVDDALTDLDDLPGRAAAPDDPVALALRRALDGGRRPGEAALLAGVRARATRRHRRRLGVGTAGVAVAVAAAALVPNLAGPGGAPTAAGGPASASATAPLAATAAPTESAGAPDTPLRAGHDVPDRSFLTLHEVASGLSGAGIMKDHPLRQSIADPQRSGMCDLTPTSEVPPGLAQVRAVQWDDGALTRGGPSSSGMTEELTRWDTAGAALQDAAAAAAAAQACAAADAAATAGPGSLPSGQSGPTAPRNYRILTPPAGLGAHAVLTVSDAFPRGLDVRVVAVDGTVGLSVAALVIGGAPDADAAAARVADLAVTALRRATASAALDVPTDIPTDIPTPRMVTHGPGPRE